MHPYEMHWARSCSLIFYYYYSSICLGFPPLAGKAQSCSFSYSFLRPRVSISIDNPAIDLRADGWLYIKCQPERFNRFSRALETCRVVFQALGSLCIIPFFGDVLWAPHFALTLWMPSVSSSSLSEQTPNHAWDSRAAPSPPLHPSP